jgi:hypothetical protein
MAGINTGILTNASPLSSTSINELEREVLENNKTFVYLDENSKVCFAMAQGVSGIKTLAWNDAYEITTQDGILTKKHYTKDSLDTYSLKDVFQKQSYSDTWQSVNNIDSTVLEGTGSEYYSLAPSVLSFRSTAPLNELQEVQVNGQTVDPSNYTLEEGSTIVKLSIDYLNTLDEGSHEIAVVSNNQTATGGFTVRAPELNEHGFYYNQPYIFTIPIEDSDDVETVVFLFAPIDSSDNAGIMRAFDVETKAFLTAGMYSVQDGVIYMYESYPDEDSLTPVATIEEGGLNIDGLFGTIGANNFVIACDEQYTYVYDEEINGYAVTPLDPLHITSYGPIKSDINGKAVKALSADAFAGGSLFFNLDFSNFVLPNSLEHIDDSALSYCHLPSNFSIPDSVTTIGKSAFASTGFTLTSLRVPHGVQRIEDFTFNAEESSVILKTLILPDTINYIGKCAVGVGTIEFEGTIEQWHAIEKEPDYYGSTVNGMYYKPIIKCSDGQVTL